MVAIVMKDLKARQNTFALIMLIPHQNMNAEFIKNIFPGISY